MRNVTFAASQFAVTDNFDENLSLGESLIREAASQGAQAILLQELFAGFYWCKDQDPKYFDWAEPFDSSKVLQHFSKLAKELGVVLPISYFEKSGNAHFNSLAMIDADGTILDNYRKAHIPDGPGYQEKFYFSPGDTGFKVWETKIWSFRRSYLLGSVVSRNSQSASVKRCRSYLLPHGDWQRAARSRVGFSTPLATRYARS